MEPCQAKKMDRPEEASSKSPLSSRTTNREWRLAPMLDVDAKMQFYLFHHGSESIRKRNSEIFIRDEFFNAIQAETSPEEPPDEPFAPDEPKQFYLFTPLEMDELSQSSATASEHSVGARDRDWQSGAVNAPAEWSMSTMPTQVDPGSQYVPLHPAYATARPSQLQASHVQSSQYQSDVASNHAINTAVAPMQYGAPSQPQPPSQQQQQQQQQQQPPPPPREPYVVHIVNLHRSCTKETILLNLMDCTIEDIELVPIERRDYLVDAYIIVRSEDDVVRALAHNHENWSHEAQDVIIREISYANFEKAAAHLRRNPTPHIDIDSQESRQRLRDMKDAIRKVIDRMEIGETMFAFKLMSTVRRMVGEGVPWSILCPGMDSLKEYVESLPGVVVSEPWNSQSIDKARHYTPFYIERVAYRRERTSTRAPLRTPVVSDRRPRSRATYRDNHDRRCKGDDRAPPMKRARSVPQTETEYAIDLLRSIIDSHTPCLLIDVGVAFADRAGRSWKQMRLGSLVRFIGEHELASLRGPDKDGHWEISKKK